MVALVIFIVSFVTLVMFCGIVMFVVVFIDVVALTFSSPAKATLNENAKRMAVSTNISTDVEFFSYIPPYVISFRIHIKYREYFIGLSPKLAL